MAVRADAFDCYLLGVFYRPSAAMQLVQHFADADSPKDHCFVVAVCHKQEAIGQHGDHTDAGDRYEVRPSDPELSEDGGDHDVLRSNPEPPASRVREWHAAALRGNGGRTSISQSYRFLRMVMNTAVREGIIARNPCQIPGAGTVSVAERPVATPAQVVALVDAINPRYRTAVLIAAWCGLRRGEIAGLRVSDVDLTEHTITVRKARVEPLHALGQAFDKDPKSEAGKRTIAIPPHVVPLVRLHLDQLRGHGSAVREPRWHAAAGQHLVPGVRPGTEEGQS